MIICHNCGAQLADGTNFCMSCGAQQIAAQPVAPQQVAPSPVYEAPQQVAPSPVYEAPQQAAPSPVYEAPQQAAPSPVYEAPQQVAPSPVYEAPQQVAPSPVYEAPQQAAPSPVYEVPQQPQAPMAGGAAPQQPKKKMNLGILIGAIAGGAVALISIIMIVVVLILNRKTEVDLSKYVTLEIEGYDTTGMLYGYDLDKAQLLKDIMKAKGTKNVDDLKRSDVPDEIYYLIESMYLSIGDTSGSGSYSNGDTIDVEVFYADSYLEDAKITIKNEKFKYTIEGLEGLTEYDIFQGVEVTFSGMSGDGYISVNKTSDEEIYDDVYFDYDYNYELKNGDVVTVTVHTYSGADDGSYYGYKFTSTSKDYTVEGLEAYIEDISDISKDSLDVLKGIAEEKIDDEYGYNYDATMSNLSYVGSYFAKDVDSAYSNYMITVYKATLTSKDNEFEPFEIFLPIQHKYLILDGDGALKEDNVSSNLKGGFYVDGTWTYFDGYNDPYTMYEELVGDYDSYYEFTETSDMPDFSERPEVEVPSTDDIPATGDDESDDSEGGFGMGGDEEDAA